MIVTVPATGQFSPLIQRHSLFVSLAATSDDIQQCLRLRHQVFAEEMGAVLDSPHEGLDQDYFDNYARHLMVKDNQTGAVVATTRLISSKTAELAGAFYSETEFELEHVLSMKATFLEVGRTCVADSHRNGSALGLLWRGIVRIAMMDNVDYLIGCVSIPLTPSCAYAHAIMRLLKQRHYSAEHQRVYPKCALPPDDNQDIVDVILPSLLKAYLRLGAQICGEAFYDESFNVADVFILLDRGLVEKRFSRHLA